MKRKNTKTIFSISSILILLLAFILLPKDRFTKNNDAALLWPTTRTRYVPAPTTASDSAKLLVAKSQRPSSVFTLQTAEFGENGYVVISGADVELGRSEILSGRVNDLEVSLGKETTDGDIVTVVLFDEEDNEITRSEVLITATAMLPGIILPKDLE